MVNSEKGCYNVHKAVTPEQINLSLSVRTALLLISKGYFKWSSDLRKLPNLPQLLIWGVLSFLLLLSGVASGNIVTVIIGATLVFAGASMYLTSRVESESRVKKALEVVSAIIAMAIVVFGFAITGSLLLGFLTCFIAVMFSIAFTLSYLLPKLRGESAQRKR